MTTMIDDKKFRCPRCGGDTVRDFTTHAVVTSQILRFVIDSDGRAFADNETKYELYDFAGGDESEYECDECSLPLDVHELSEMVVEEEKTP